MPRQKNFNQEEILEKAATLFQQKGFNGTSMDEVLNVTGLSRSSLYDTFKDKHTLYLKSLEHYNSKGKTKIDQLDEKKLDGLKKIEVLFKEVVNHLADNPNDNGCLLVNAAAEMSKQCFKTQQVICNNKNDVQNLLEEWLKDAQEQKVVKLKLPVSHYAQFLYNTLLGLRVMSQGGAVKQEMTNVVKVSLSSIN